MMTDPSVVRDLQTKYILQEANEKINNFKPE